MQRGADALRLGGSWALTITQHMRRALGAALMSTYGRRGCVAPGTVLRLHVPDACRGSAATDPGISGWRCGCNASPPLGGGISVPSLSTWWSLSARWRPTRGDTVAGGARMTPAVLAWWQSAPTVVETGRQATVSIVAQGSRLQAATAVPGPAGSATHLPVCWTHGTRGAAQLTGWMRLQAVISKYNGMTISVSIAGAH